MNTLRKIKTKLSPKSHDSDTATSNNNGMKKRDVPQSLPDASNDFGIRLLTQLDKSLKGEENRNIMIAVTSIFEVMRMVSAGATEGGVVEQELRGVLGESVGKEDEKFGKVSEGGEGVSVKVGNGLFARGTIKEEYKAEIAKRGGEVEELESAEQVNKWIGEKTEGMIDKIVDDVDPMTACVLANGVYFKGAWSKVFMKELTKEGDFTMSSGKKKKVMYMNRNDKSMKYAYMKCGADQDCAEAVELPYGEDGKYSAVFIVMRAGRRNHMINALAKGGSEVWNGWMKKLWPREVNLSVPRFKMEYGVKSLKDDLEKLGFSAAFNRSSDDMFLKMTDRKDLYIDEFAHKTVVEVNEEGTTAAGATGAAFGMRSMPPPPVNLVIDRPFLFAIRHVESGALLFLGRVDEPESQ